MTLIQKQARVLWNRPEKGDCYRIRLACAREFKDARPGQFVMVHLGTRHASLLRRPFSIFNLVRSHGKIDGIDLLYKVVGQVTERLSRCEKDDLLDVVGPLGHGFRFSGQGPFYLAAGGIGVAPIHFLSRYMISKGIDPRSCRVFIGGRNQADVLCEKEFLDLGIPVTLATDDGSVGQHCLITDPLETAIAERKPQQVFACGPEGMLHCVAGIVSRYEVSCQISTETLMACGLGACLGCAVKGGKTTDGGYLHTCVHGPVFNTDELQWSGAID
jgi:dihydroorotate dehydrogenase electron transfer subunit